MNFKNLVKKTTRKLLVPTILSASMATTAPAYAGLLGNLLSKPATVASVGMDFEAYVTLLNPDGRVVRNPSLLDEPTYHGFRNPVKGHMVFNVTSEGLVGAATFEPFEFFGTPASGRDITIVPAHTVVGIMPTDTLMVANMLFDWNGNNGIPVSIVVDIGGLTSALNNTFKGQVLKGLLTAESENTTVRPGDDITMGPVLVATTSQNTSDVDTDGDGMPGPIALGDNPSGTIPLLVDTVTDLTNGDIGIGGSPMKDGPFTGFNANFDVKTMTVTCVSGILSNCESGGLKVPQINLSAQPLEPLLNFLHIQ